jgi:hypothetical protein
VLKRGALFAEKFNPVNRREELILMNSRNHVRRGAGFQLN